MPPDCGLQRTTSPCGLAEAKNVVQEGSSLPASRAGSCPRTSPGKHLSKLSQAPGGFAWMWKASERPAHRLGDGSSHLGEE